MADKIPLYVHPDRYDYLQQFHSFLESGNSIGMTIKTYICSNEQKHIVPLSQFKNALWESIRIIIYSEDNIAIWCKGQKNSRVYTNCKEMGFKDSRNNKIKPIWSIFENMAENKGVLLPPKVKPNGKAKMIKMRISKMLITLFCKDKNDDPFIRYSDDVGYKLKLYLSDDKYSRSDTLQYNDAMKQKNLSNSSYESIYDDNISAA